MDIFKLSRVDCITKEIPIEEIQIYSSFKKAFNSSLPPQITHWAKIFKKKDLPSYSKKTGSVFPQYCQNPDHLLVEKWNWDHQQIGMNSSWVSVVEAQPHSLFPDLRSAMLELHQLENTGRVSFLGIHVIYCSIYLKIQTPSLFLFKQELHLSSLYFLHFSFIWGDLAFAF